MSSGNGPSSKNFKPTYSRFTQQELPACKLILTPRLIMATFIIVGIIFIAIGHAHLSASNDVVEIIKQYDDECIPIEFKNLEGANNKMVRYMQEAQQKNNCVTYVTVSKKMTQPIYVYYQLDNFYQSHRRYVKSQSYKQYMEASEINDTENCEPEATINELPIVPCGLIAWSLFNDTYSLSRNGNPLPINRKDIAWTSDKAHKFGSDVYPKRFQSRGLIGGAQLDTQIPLNQQEELLVWMRTAALPTFRKLYGRIETDLEANEIIKVEIQNNYNTYSFNGKKKLIISTTTWIGGKNNALGKLYTAVGALSIFIAIAYTIAYLIKPRPLGDPSYLSWNRNPASTK